MSHDQGRRRDDATNECRSFATPLDIRRRIGTTSTDDDARASAKTNWMNVFTARAPRASARGRVVVDVDDFNDDDDDFDDDDDDDDDSDSEDGDELKRPMGDRMKAEEEKRQKYKARVNAGEGAQVVIIGDDDVPYAAWRCAVLEREDSDEDPGLALRALRARASEPWVVVLARGGAFAAAVFDARKFVGDGEAPKASALEHATASRYVVRAKAGGRQVTKDQGGKNIKSAGSSLRRANEQALEADMRAVFERWKDVVAVRFAFERRIIAMFKGVRVATARTTRGVNIRMMTNQTRDGWCIASIAWLRFRAREQTSSTRASEVGASERFAARASVERMRRDDRARVARFRA